MKKHSVTAQAFVALLVALLFLLGVAMLAYRSLDALVEPGYNESLSADVRWQIKILLTLVSAASVLVAAAGAALGFQHMGRRRERIALIESERRHRELSTQLAANNAELLAYTYTVSHDLRAPLRAMEGFANAIIEDEGDRLDAAGIGYARQIAAAAQRMDRLILDLLAYSRVGHEDFHMHEVRLDSAVRDATAQLSAEIQASGAKITVANPLPEVHGHHALLLQLVVNLLSNAIKFVPKGQTPVISIDYRRDGEGVILIVRDNGIGIARQHQDRIFRVFERLHGVETYPGTGIGLAIVRRAAERMGGAVSVESEPGAGSAFHVRLGSYHRS